MTRGQRGRLISRMLLLVAVCAAALTVFLWIAAPGWIGPMFVNVPRGAIITLIGVAGVIVGLAWMIRVYRSDPEPDQRAWRYREHD